MKERYGLIDFIRGVDMISMILFHACWDLQYMFGVNVPGYTGRPGEIWQRSICITFIVLSGLCLALKRNNHAGFVKRFKRGIIVSLCGVIITAVTTAFMPENSIYFGILTFIGFAMIFVELINPFLKKINPYIGGVICTLVYIMTERIQTGFIKIPLAFINRQPLLIEMPDFLYKNMITAFLGFPNRSFVSVDYFPVIPWIFIYIAGYFLGVMLTKTKLIELFKLPRNTIFNWIGKKSLFIYMLHQPVVYLVLMLIFTIVKP